MRNCLLPLVFVSMLLSCHPPSATTQGQPSADSSLVTTNPTTAFPADEAIYFKASGTEPFWNITLSNTIIKFASLVEGFEKFAIPHVEPTRAVDTHVTSYQAETEAGQLIVEIDSSECINAMSGAAYPYQVTVSIRRGIDQKAKKFDGCGQYISNYRLHDLWALESLKGVSADEMQFRQKRPSLEIDIRNASFMGFAGCNRMRGKLVAEREQIGFIDIFTTRMACSSSSAEAEFLTALRSATTFRIGNNRLYLSGPRGELLVFRKID